MRKEKEKIYTYEEAMKLKEQWIKEKEDDIRRYKKYISEAYIKAEIAISGCGDLSKKEKNTLRSLFDSFSPKRHRRNNNLVERIKKAIEKQEGMSSIGSYKIKEMLKEKLSRYKNKADLFYSGLEDLSQNIFCNPKHIIIDSAEAIAKYYRYIKEKEKEIKNPPEYKYINPQTRNNEHKNKYITQEKNTEQNTTHQSHKNTYGDIDTKQDKFETIKEFSKRLYEEKAKNRFEEHQLTDEEKAIIENLFTIYHNGQKYNHGHYQIEKRIEQLLKYNYYLNKVKEFQKEFSFSLISRKSPNLVDHMHSYLHWMSSIILQVLPEELTTYRKATYLVSITFEEIHNKFGLMNLLSEYEKAYNQYKKCYNKLSEEKKEILNKKDKEYPELIPPTPKTLKHMVNNKITNILVNNKYIDIISINDPDKNPDALLRKATTFMSKDEVINLYRKMYEKGSYFNPYTTSGRTEEQKERIKNEQREFQRNIAYILISKLTKEEKNNKTQDELLYYVCKELLHEEPLFEINIKIKEEKIPDEKTEKNAKASDTEKKETKTIENSTHSKAIESVTNPAIAAGHDAMNRFFGMKKTEQTLQRINGEWKKFERTWKKAQEAKDKTEINELTEELNNMFKR